MSEEYVIHTEEVNGKTISILPDVEPWNPREEDEGNVSIMACFHGRYSLGDKHDMRSEDFSGWDEMEEFLRKKKGAILVMELWLYDHSGLHIKVGDFNGMLPQGHAQFDTGRVGFVYTTKERIRKNWGVKYVTKKYRELARKGILGEVEYYDSYLSGDVCGFTVKDKDGEVLESCWGFIGCYDECLAEARACVT